LIADRLALSLINLRQVQESGFKKTEVGAVIMKMKQEKRCSWLIRKGNRKKLYIVSG
jgi:CRISPR-associated protein Cas1